MNAFSLINTQACVEIGRTDFLAAELAQRTERRAAAADPFAALAAKINADLAHDPRAGMTPAQRKRDFAASQISSAKASLRNLREAADFTARCWGWTRAQALACHRQHAEATFALVKLYRRNAAEAFAEARKLEAADRLSPELARVMLASFKLGVC